MHETGYVYICRHLFVLYVWKMFVVIVRVLDIDIEPNVGQYHVERR